MRARGRARVRAPLSQCSFPPPSATRHPLASLPLPPHSTGSRRVVGCCWASLRVGATGGTHGGAAAARPLFTAASPPSLSPCCARAVRTFPSPPTRPPGCVSRNRCVHVSLPRSPRCAHVRAHTAPGSARVCEGLGGAALEASAPQNRRPKPPPLILRLQASGPGLQARPCRPSLRPCGGPTLSTASRPQTPGWTSPWPARAQG